jgi:WhiB family redox-sensing transcriptional regulator
MLNNIKVNGRKIKRTQIRDLAVALPERSIDWRDGAKCRGEDLELFIYASDLPTDRQRRKLKSICDGCPVIEDCRYEGVRTMSDGWWGGMTPQERYKWAAETIFADKL